MVKEQQGDWCGWRGESEGESGREMRSERERGQIMKGFEGHNQDVGFNYEGDGELLEDFEQRSVI